MSFFDFLKRYNQRRAEKKWLKKQEEQRRIDQYLNTVHADTLSANSPDDDLRRTLSSRAAQAIQPQPHGAEFRVRIQYEDANGNISSRIIQPRALTEDYGDTALYGYCELRQALRTFRLDRVRELVAMDTGEIIEDDLKAWLRSQLGTKSTSPTHSSGQRSKQVKRRAPYSKPETIRKKISSIEWELTNVGSEILRAERNLQKAEQKAEKWIALIKHIETNGLAGIVRTSDAGAEKLLAIGEDKSLNWTTNLDEATLMPCEIAEKLALKIDLEIRSGYVVMHETEASFIIEISSVASKAMENYENARLDLEEAYERPNDLQNELEKMQERLRMAEAGLL